MHIWRLPTQYPNWVSIILVTVVLMGAPRGADAQTAAELFDATAFGPAERTGGGIYRWEEAPTVRLTGPSARRHRQWVTDQVEELADLTGLSLSRIDSIGADILVVFVDSFDDVLAGNYNDLLDRYSAGPERRDSILTGFRQTGAVCAGQVVAQNNRLTAGIVFIPRDQLAPVVRACISAQLTRVMGLPFAAPKSAGSALAEDSPHSHLTPLDRTAIRLLYHPRMRPGLSRTDAATVVRSVIGDVGRRP